jgi:uncharacterized membrane protein YqjE
MNSYRTGTDNVRYIDRDNHNLRNTIRELGEQLRNFLNTRLELLKSELKENIKDSSKAAVYGAIALVLVLTAYLLLTLAVVALVAVAFAGNAYAWFFALAIVGFVWLILGGAIAMVAKREFRGLAPQHTLRVLKQDKIWIEEEARQS